MRFFRVLVAFSLIVNFASFTFCQKKELVKSVTSIEGARKFYREEKRRKKENKKEFEKLKKECEVLKNKIVEWRRETAKLERKIVKVQRKTSKLQESCGGFMFWRSPFLKIYNFLRS